MPIYRVEESGTHPDLCSYALSESSLYGALNQGYAKAHAKARPLSRSAWVRVTVNPEGDDVTMSGIVSIHPEAPACKPGEAHDWRNPYAVVGGDPDHPGIAQRGLGCVTTTVCRHCGVYRIVDDTGEAEGAPEADPEDREGWLCEAYRPADPVSLAWVEALDSMDVPSCETATKHTGVGAPARAAVPYLLVVMGDVEPATLGPYRDAEERDQEARNWRAREGDADGLYRLDIDALGIPQVSPYSASFFDSEEDA